VEGDHRAWTHSRRRRVDGAGRATALALAALTLVIAASLRAPSPARAASAGILPPRNPNADCRRALIATSFTLTDINSCRAKEGVGKLALPSNWRSLSPPRRLLVLVDLERVNRGRAPILGLTSNLDRPAQRAAAARLDPALPGGHDGGAIWAGAASVAGADDTWMYYDGRGGLDLNVDCGVTTRRACWLHRDIILWSHGRRLVAGAGYANGRGGGSYTFAVVAGYAHPALNFSWARELRYFHSRPRVERAAVRR
jgi:hypothetical protein